MADEIKIRKKTLKLEKKYKIYIFFKGTVSIIPCDVTYKDGNARFTTVPL